MQMKQNILCPLEVYLLVEHDLSEESADAIVGHARATQIFNILQNGGAALRNMSVPPVKDGNKIIPRISSQGVLECPHCPYSTDKKANWYKHKKKHSGEHELCFPHIRTLAAIKKMTKQKTQNKARTKTNCAGKDVLSKRCAWQTAQLSVARCCVQPPSPEKKKNNVRGGFFLPLLMCSGKSSFWSFVPINFRTATLPV